MTSIHHGACPRCGKVFDRVSFSGDMDLELPPSPGDLTICIQCGAVLTFVASNTEPEPAKLHLRSLSSDELIALPRSTRRTIATIQQAISATKVQH